MYCMGCDKEIDGEAALCVDCGAVDLAKICILQSNALDLHEHIRDLGRKLFRARKLTLANQLYRQIMTDGALHMRAGIEKALEMAKDADLDGAIGIMEDLLVPMDSRD